MRSLNETRGNFWCLLITKLPLKASLGYIYVFDFMVSQGKFAAALGCQFSLMNEKERKGKEMEETEFL